MATRTLERGHEEGDVSIVGLNRCIAKLVALRDLIHSTDEEFGFGSAAYDGLGWMLQDVADDLKFLEEHYDLVEKEAEKEETDGNEAGE